MMLGWTIPTSFITVPLAPPTPLNEYVYSQGGAFVPNPDLYANNADYHQGWDAAMAWHVATYHVAPSISVGSNADVFMSIIEQHMSMYPALQLLGEAPPILFYQGHEPTTADWGSNTTYASKAVGRAEGVVNGMVFYTSFAPAIFSGSAERPSYMYQDWAYPDWIAQQVAAGKIKAYTYNGTAGMLVAPDVVKDQRFQLTLTGTYRGSNNTDNGLLSYIATIAQVVAFVFPPAAPIAQPIATALTAYDAVNTGNILEGLGAALAIPGVPNLTLATVGTTAITASNVVGAANVVQGVSNNNLLQAVSGAVALPGISDLYNSAVNSIENYISGSTLPAPEQAPAPVSDATPTPVPTIPNELNPQILDTVPSVAQYPQGTNPLELIGNTANVSPSVPNELNPQILDTAPGVAQYANPLENIATTSPTKTGSITDTVTSAAAALPSLKTIGTALSVAGSALSLEQRLNPTNKPTATTPIYSLNTGMQTPNATDTGLTFTNFAPILFAIGAVILGSS